ncbi:MAG: riboflavin biosynthesis protein RibF [Flavobacteriales bacterium]|nr:riboflavin biosynthesis protein RibF [Flavobacteriales bacterium]|tara:strand:- start:23384 stop:24307 length:924 start_codon:yes stop_codon:yes gene_type:complete
MKIHKGFDSFKKLSKAVVTTGTFDGVHLGHKKILNSLINIGKSTNSETVLVTFFPHPRIVLFPDQELKLINTMNENLQLYKKYNIDHLVLQPFNKEFSRITSLEYIRDFLFKKIGLKDLVIGFDHHFGRNREGSLLNLKEYAELYEFNIHKINPLNINNISISSSKIRNAIQLGDISLANDYLGYMFHISGIVSKGKGLGRTLGFPTANIKIHNQNKILPKQGVYAVSIFYNNHKYNGMLNIGTNPTFDNKTLSIEVNIFEFNQNIYGESITIEFVSRIRSEKKFKSVDDLKYQLSIDKIASLNILN